MADRLDKHIAAQQVLFDVSQGFTQIMSADVDEQINWTLQRLGSYDGDDRCYVFLFSEDGLRMTNTHEWCAPDIEPQIDNLKDILSEVFPWWMQKLNKLECIHVSDVTRMEPQAQAEKDLLMEQDIQSILVLPIVREKHLVGYIGFDSVCRKKTWSDSSISLLRITANVIGNALHQKAMLTALEKSEKQYRSIFERTGTPSLIINNEAKVTELNQCWIDVFGHRLEDIGDRFLEEIVGHDYREIMMNYHLERRKNPGQVPNEYYAEIYDVAGQRRKCKVYADIIPGTGMTVASFVDLTEMDRISRSFRALGEINKTVLRAKQEGDMLDEVCRIMVEIGGYNCAWAGCTERREEGVLGLKLIRAFGNDHLLTCVNNSYVLMEDGVEQEALLTDQGIVINDLASESKSVLFRKEALEQGVKSVALLPITYPGTTVRQLLAIYSDNSGTFDNEEMCLMEDMVSNIAYGICALRTRSERDATAASLQASTDNLNLLMHQTVKAFKAVVQTRDPYTAEHQDKVAQLSLAIAKQMGLSDEMCSEVFLAASIHDIGKINVPSDILNKPGQLSHYEFGLIMGHCRTGYEILQNINFPWSVARIILQHHERLDGTGYPEGIAGGEILLSARILSVADVFDAMSSHRPYRPALGPEYALKELESNRGRLYDKQVVDACLAVFESGFTFE